jgi:biotin/methionine sulfoxide reductase
VSNPASPFLFHSAHWGAFYARSGPRGIDIVPHPADPAPSPLLGNLPDTLDPDCRVRMPVIRRGWLESCTASMISARSARRPRLPIANPSP